MIDPALEQRRIVLCVAGGIAAYKSVALLRLLVQAGCDVQVVMSERAQAFVGALTFQTLSGHSVFTDMFDNRQDADIGHIRVVDGADLILVAPATANLLSQMVAGVASTPITAAVLASRCPILVAPAMNVNMWESPATQSNVATLQDRGMAFVGPDRGFLACQWTGSGRLSEPADILEAAAAVLSPKDCQNLRFVISAGGTREAIDPVRFIGNRSTGKMGYALARAAARRGAIVTLISGPTDLPTPVANTQQVQTAAQMSTAVLAASTAADVIVMAAAVADYTPAQVSPQKCKKADWGPAPTLPLQRTNDILAQLGQMRATSNRDAAAQTLVGFAAETQNIAAAAQQKLDDKQCDLIVANDVSRADRGFGSEENAVLLLWKQGQETIELASKDKIAHAILDRILQLRHTETP